MVDSELVLKGQTIAYTLYVLAILALMGWFAWRVTRPGTSSQLRPGWFYAFVGALVPGLKGVLGIFTPATSNTREAVPATPAAVA